MRRSEWTFSDTWIVIFYSHVHEMQENTDHLIPDNFFYILLLTVFIGKILT